MNYRMLLPLFLLAGLAYAMAAPQTASQQAENEVNKGIQAYKYYRYESAIEHFRQATKLDPQSRTATLCLATTLAQELVTGPRDFALDIPISPRGLGFDFQLPNYQLTQLPNS